VPANAQVRRIRRLAYAADLPAGVMKEHLHTRGHVRPVRHLAYEAVRRVERSGAAAMLSKACPIDAAALPGRQSKYYSFFLNDQAGILDDLIVTRLGRRDRSWLSPTPGMRQPTKRTMRDIARHGYNVVRRTARPRVSGDPGARGSG
jgi:aminomethyltransferase